MTTAQVQVFSNDGRRIGAVEGNAFVKRVKGSSHFIRIPTKSISFDVDSINRAEAEGADRVDVLDVETGKHYRMTFKRIRTYKPINRQGDLRYIIPIGDFNHPDETQIGLGI